MTDSLAGPLTPHALIFLAALAAGFVNAMAGGGTFFSYPAFVAAGVPPALASASNTVGLWAGNAISAFAYRRELYALRDQVGRLAAVALAGSASGAALLLALGNAGFARVLPPLVLFATLIFVYAERIRHWALTRTSRPPNTGNDALRANRGSLAGLGIVTFYGGFFGGGGNLLLMATLSLMGYQNVQHNNALKNLLATLMITSAFVVFLIQDSIAWPQTIACFIGSTTGGLLGARVARRMPMSWLRRVVIVVGFALTAIYTWQYWIRPFAL